MQNTEIVVVNITEGGSGFGHRTDNGDTVFVPKSVVTGGRVELLGRYSAQIITNQFRADVPWMAVRVTAVDADETPDPDSDDLPDWIKFGRSEGKKHDQPHRIH